MVSLANSLARLRVDSVRLAQRTGLAAGRVKEIFDGAEPTVYELRTISTYLRLPADALMRVHESTGQADLRYRAEPLKQPSLTAEARIHEIGKLLQRANLLPPRKLDLRVFASLENRRSVEDAADLIRQAFCTDEEMLDPLPNLVERIDRSGLAYTVVLADLGIEGASGLVDGRGLIVIAARTFKPRMLFTCAHELAHLLLGHIDPAKWLVDEDTIESFETSNEEERLCNALASAILQPAEAVARFLKLTRDHYKLPEDAISATEILLTGRYFGASFLTAAMRLEQLEIAPRGTGASLDAAIKADHQSAEAYGDQLGLPARTPIEMPVLSEQLRVAVRAGVDRGEISLGRVADTFGYSTVEMADALS